MHFNMPKTGDGLDHLRIPYEKLEFGKLLEDLGNGYGTVSQGKFDGQDVALKRLNFTNLVNVKPKLLAEILTISRVQKHSNLVALRGFCEEHNEMILVYELVSSGNLKDKMINKLNTSQRFNICLGAARGLEYLHTSNTVHGNIKPSKVLLNLDGNTKIFVAKVSGFGLSKTMPGMKTGKAKATKESDVYAFGVVLLEMLCGVLELVDTDDYVERHVTEIVPKKLQKGDYNELLKLAHKDIEKDVKPKALETYVKIACECVVGEKEARPTMGRVVEELEKALRLQGGEVTCVQIPGVTVESIIHGNEPEEVSIPTVEEDVKDSKPEDRLNGAGGGNGAEGGNGDEFSVVGTVSKSRKEASNTDGNVSNAQLLASSNGNAQVVIKTLPDKSIFCYQEKQSTDYGNCGCCCCLCSFWRFISESLLYGGQFWNKLVSWFSWITGQCSSKRD